MTGRWRSPLGFRGSTLVVLLGLLPWATGCFNPEFLNTNVGGFYAIAPGDLPYVLVRIINDTTATLDLPVVYEDGVYTHEYEITGLTSEVRETGILLEWPVTRVALGDLDDPLLPSITASLADGSVSGVPFGHPALQYNVDYGRGDAIIFHITEDARNPVFVTVSIGIIDGDAQPATYARADPFEMVQVILAVSGF